MPKSIIESAYEMIGELTPLKRDCGRICGAACCSSDGYMLLFPYELEIAQKEGYTITSKSLEGYGGVYAAVCDGTCDREKRPLSCRIFPLAPKFIEGKLFVRMDPRAKNVCPLSHKPILSLDKEFTNIIEKTLNMLCCDDKTSRYLKAVSDIADEYDSLLNF